jgi:hypothetical protein
VENQAGIAILQAETLHACTALDEKPRRLPTALQEALAHVAPGRLPTQVS